jgi:hypothetical protein
MAENPHRLVERHRRFSLERFLKVQAADAAGTLD